MTQITSAGREPPLPPELEGRPEPVGYASPPRASRWKKGQSGNRRGRPKKTPDLFERLDKILSETIILMVGGEPLRMSREEARLRALAAKAARGDTAAVREIQRERAMFPAAKIDTRESDVEKARARLDMLFPPGWNAKTSLDKDVP